MLMAYQNNFTHLRFIFQSQPTSLTLFCSCPFLISSITLNSLPIYGSNTCFFLPLKVGRCVCVCLCVCMHLRACSVAQSCLTLCDPVDCSLPDSSVGGIYQARILEWVVISSSKGSSSPGIEPASPALQVDSLPPEKPVCIHVCLELLL